MNILKFVAVIVVFYSQSNIGVNAVPVEIDLRMTPEQTRVMKKVVNLIQKGTFLNTSFKSWSNNKDIFLQYFSLRRS